MRILSGTLLCALLPALFNSAPARAATASNAAPSVQVATVPATYAALAQTVRAYGVVAMGPSETTDINLPFAARIARLEVGAGQRVRRGDLLAEVAPDPAAALAYRQALSAVALAGGELARVRQLLEQQLATQSQLAQARKALDDANAALAAQQRSGAPTESMRRVVAPFDGVVIALTATQGMQLAAGASMMQLGHDHAGAGSAPLKVALAVNPSDSSRIHVGAAVGLRALSAPAGAAAVKAAVVYVGGAIDQQTQLVNLVAVLVGHVAGTPVMLPGARVAADIAVSQNRHWIVPRSAVLRDEKGDYLFQVDAGHAVRIAVKTAVDDGAQLGVDGPLKPSLPVVSVGNYELQQGMPVRGLAGAAR